MADPRAVISGEDTGLEYDTFKIDNSTITYSETADFGSAQAGVNLCVTPPADNTIALADDVQYALGMLAARSEIDCASISRPTPLSKEKRPLFRLCYPTFFLARLPY